MRLTWRLTTNVLAETVKVEERLLDVIDELKADDMIAVNPLSEMVRSLPGFELSE